MSAHQSDHAFPSSPNRSEASKVPARSAWVIHALALACSLLAGFAIGFVASFDAFTDASRGINQTPSPDSLSRTGYWGHEPHRLTLSHYVDYMVFLPENATEARAKLRTLCEPIIPKRAGEHAPDFVRVSPEESFAFLDTIPAGAHEAQRMLLSTGTGPASRIALPEWRADYEPFLARLPADLAFLRELPRYDGDHVEIDSPELMQAIDRAIAYVRQSEPKPLPSPWPTRH